MIILSIIRGEDKKLEDFEFEKWRHFCLKMETILSEKGGEFFKRAEGRILIVKTEHFGCF